MNILPGTVFIFIISNFTLTFAYITGSDCPQYPNECNVILTSDFKCFASPGIYPDPMNCRVYYYCAAGASIPERYECPNGFIYNTWFHSCELEPENVTDVCAGRRFECDKPENVEKVIPFQFHPTYYAYCTFTAANTTGVYVETWMLKCLYEELQEYTLAEPRMCRFACRQKGFFQNPERCQEYVYCSGDKAVPTVMQCPTNYVYDGTRCTTDKTKCLYP